MTGNTLNTAMSFDCEEPLREYFPKLPTHKELLTQIRSSDRFLETFSSWPAGRQQEFLDFCCGSRGVRVLYDPFFKEVFSPEYYPQRLMRLLGLILEKEITSIQVLQNDSVRLADEKTLVITDIVVEQQDGSIVNVEVQKIGFAFTGERTACYSADLLLRQYKRVHDERGRAFKYKDLRPVYTIIFIERSGRDFAAFPEQYIHHFSASSDTGLELEHLQHYYYIPLDIFRKNRHDKGISSELEAWLTFLSCDEPEMIRKLITDYPDFRACYTDIYRLFQNMEDIMGIFSDELRIMDENTIDYMIDELSEDNKALRKQNSELQSTIADKDSALSAMSFTLSERDSAIASRDSVIADLQRQIEALKAQQAEILAETPTAYNSAK